MMAIRKRGNGWQVRVRPFPDKTMPTRASAERVERALKERKALGDLFVEAPSTFGAELDGRLERKRAMGGRRGQLRPRSVAFNEQCARPWQPLREIPIPNLTRAIVENHIVTRARVAPVAASNELEFAKAALRDAESRGQRVDAGIFLIDPIRSDTREGVALTLDQLDLIASFMPERIQRIVPFCGTTALRWSEAVNLDDTMVDLDRAELLIPRWLNKSRKAKPIPLARAEAQLLREQMLARPAGTTIVFANAAGGVYSKSGFRSVWSPAVRAAGLDVRFHDLRHTATSLMCMAGMRPELVAERRGDADGGALVLGRYRHLFPSELRNAVGLVDELVDRARQVSSGREVVDAG